MVNWKVNNNSAYPLKIGEEISLKDGGKIFIENIEITAKGRFRITANRFL
jgi:RNA-binding protein YlmH